MPFILLKIHPLLVAILFVIFGLIVMLILYSLPYFISFPFRVLYRAIFHRLKTKEAIYDVWFEDECKFDTPQTDLDKYKEINSSSKHW